MILSSLVFLLAALYCFVCGGLKNNNNYKRICIAACWWRGTVVERRSLAGELSLSCARPAADG